MRKFYVQLDFKFYENLKSLQYHSAYYYKYSCLWYSRSYSKTNLKDQKERFISPKVANMQTKTI